MTQSASDQAGVPASMGFASSALEVQPTPLSGQQRALISVLGERNPLLGSMYVGGIRVLGDASNPERFAHCAHSMRELMEKLPELLDVPAKAHKESLKTKVVELHGTYNGTRKKTTCFNALSGWDGSIDVMLKKFLVRVDTFFEWFEEHHPRRQNELRDLLARLDGTGRELPDSLSSLNVQAWQLMKDYFQSVSHHRKTADEKDFLHWIDATEKFLLDRLRPRTFEDFSAIDSLLEEGGGHA
jgi:hypothetical protein